MNDALKIENNDIMNKFQKTENILNDVQNIIEVSQKEAYEQTWSVRTLQRNIDTQYYYRLLQSKDKDAVEHEMQEKTFEYQQDKLEFIKNPVVVEMNSYLPVNINYICLRKKNCVKK